MTIKSIVEAFESEQIILNILFNSFTYGSESYYSLDQSIVYRNIYCCTPIISDQSTLGMITYKWVLIFSDWSLQGLENQLEIMSNLDSSVIYYMNDLQNYIDNNNLSMSLGNPSYLHYQQNALDQAYIIRVEFDVEVPITQCIDLSQFNPVC